MTTLNVPSDVICPPTDLWSDEPPLESDLHLQQIILLLSCLESFWSDRNDYYATGNLTIYYNTEQLKKRDFCGPDFFVVLNTEKRPRKSWVVWGENGQYPHVIVEILSDSTAKVDRTKKKELYRNIFRTPNYFWFDPVSLEFQGFRLSQGKYEPIQPNEKGYLWSDQLELYLGIHDGKLRYFTPEEELVLTPQEKVKDLENNQLLAVIRLQELGLTLEQIADALSLSVEQVRTILSQQSSDSSN
ncbi:unknown [Crocosphaera subtropica ATCC 51142]|uniref:Putative restriction endonuclease domain-containing protein n=1 Tax=Crocosphaera subtropica (strain ATCC 51142 / BH68) TaxID=43989 RepID=B1WNS0_CROS5|nr:Uma2 family endonuclease [Crocosphaera subtropica]ACB51499.1 unknown [Crocosphaera subtropica ATCC 51142]